MRKGFTLVELLVVVGMIMLLTGAMTASVTGAMNRARVQKATAEVKIITQAILAYENERQGNGEAELPTCDKQDCDASSLGFLLGRGNSASGKLPVYLMASLSSNGKLLDPWGHPYKVTIKKSTSRPTFRTMTGSMQTGFYLPNFYRLREGER